jgi:hypothetical protein
MPVPSEFSREFAAFPAVLRDLVEAELAAGNSIVEITSGFPAPPAGACLKLARNIGTRPRESGDGLNFYERNNSSYLGEITDTRRHFFVLEPPGPPEPEPDMDAIRAERQARYAATMAELINTPSAPPEPKRARISFVPPPAAVPQGAVARFRESMEMNYDRWHDGTGYDLDILKTCTRAERLEIEGLIAGSPVTDWRDVEALAALDTRRAHDRLREALHSDDHRLAMAVLQEAPKLFTDGERTAALVAALEVAEIYTGLTQALEILIEYHPPEVIAALFRGLREREGGCAVHFAARLMYLHGKAKEPFDWEQRPFFLRFHTEDRAERESVLHELCALMGVPVPS